MFGSKLETMLDKFGTEYTIVRDDGNVSGERLISKMNRQATKPFIREHFLEATLDSATPTLAGDIIRFGDNRTLLVANLTPREIGNDIYDHQAVLFLSNVSGELKRFSGEARNPQYRKTNVWNTVQIDCYALLSEEDFGNYLDQDEPIGQVQNRALFLYFPKSAGVQPLDRYEARSGEYYKVEEVERYRYPGLDLAHVEEDTRE